MEDCNFLCAGPAETIKTKTTKDLAKALACKCVVFNCSVQIDYIKQWTDSSLDLSKLKQQLTHFEFEGNAIELNSNYLFFITMNLYFAEQTELHENLNALFRPVALMIPDYALIAEIMLFSKIISILVMASALKRKYDTLSEDTLLI
ncbi:MAG: putative Dynein heavy chain [Streblomastix strix]|uniref:Putative Dynein heavy chain n=1 Tax=Streblomastix strix TaxID=222440 RepID=A0A5J4WB63_9EUKA|nr:MAG: putative Dynein heavy chain [Streblomastix strix]